MKCSQKTCENEAAFSFVWTEYSYCCDECLPKILAVAEHIGFPTPANTLRPLLLDTPVKEADSA